MKKLIISLLCMIFMFGIVAYAENENTTDFFGGNGSVDNPYLIGKKEHLNSVRNYLDAHFELVTDITFTEEDFAEDGLFYNDGNGWLPIGTEANPFLGTFDGAGKMICGLNTKASNSTFEMAGLFGKNQGTIKSLNLEEINCYANKNNNANVYVGGIVAYNHGIVESCNVSGYISSSTLTGSGNYPNGYLGGISGINTGTIKNCSNKVDLNTGVLYHSSEYGSLKYIGGITGYNKGMVSACYNIGNIKNAHFSGGITGYNEDIINNCFNIGTVRAVSPASDNISNAGGICGINSGTVSTTYNAGMVVTTGNNPLIYESTGTITDCYYYSCSLDYGEFQNGLSKEQMQEEQTFSGFDFSDIWMFEEDSQYPFPVLKDTISISLSKSSTELFGSGLGFFWDPYVISTFEHFNNIRQFPNACYILTDNISISASAWEPFEFLGAIDGGGNTVSIGGTCTMTGSINNGYWNNSYGIFLSNGGVIQKINIITNLKIILYGKINLSIGGLTSRNEGLIRNCKSSGSLNTTEDNKDYAYGSVDIGGITGRNNGIITDCINSSIVKADNKIGSVGGIVGYSEMGSVVSCSNIGSITAIGDIHGASVNMAAGGIIGENYEAQIVKCVNNGEIIASANAYKKSGYGYSGIYLQSKAGGIVGWWNPNNTEGGKLEGEITDCINNGNISSTSKTSGVPVNGLIAISGGICGSSVYTVEPPGLLGPSLSGYGTYYIARCVNSGNVSASKSNTYGSPIYAGAISGITAGTIEDCYSIGTTYRVWTKTSTETYPKEKMLVQDTYTSFDFEKDWVMLPGAYPYPQLRRNLATPVKSIYVAQQPSAPLECVNGHFVSYNGLKVGIRFEDGTSVVAEPWSECFSLLDINSKGTHSIPLTVLECKTDDIVNIIVRDKLLISIAVETQPTKTRYFIDEDIIDINGARLKLTYDDTSSEIVEITPEMISGFTPGKIGSQTLIVTYDGKTCPLEIIVYDVIGISVETLPSKTTYVQGQDISGAGGIFSTIFSDGLKKEHSMELAILDYPKNSIGEVQATVSYLGYTTSFTITVNKRIVKSMKIETEPLQSVYYVGQDINLDGGTVKVGFESDDNYYEVIPMTIDMISGFDNSKVGYPTITVTYAGISDTFIVRVKEYIKLTELSLDKNKLTLLVGNNYQLETTLNPDDASNKTVYWETSNNEIVSVENGLITGIKEGTAVITAYAENGTLTAKCDVVVRDTPSGDINGDTVTNIVDVIRLLNHVNGSNPLVDDSICDINSDGVVNIVDVIRLLNHVNGSNPLY